MVATTLRTKHQKLQKIYCFRKTPDINKGMTPVNFWIEPVFTTSMEKIHISDKKADLII